MYVLHMYITNSLANAVDAGIVNKTTSVEMIRIRRCGVPDIDSADSTGAHRRKRFATQGASISVAV